MGGTSFDVSLVVDGTPDVSTEVARRPAAADADRQHPHGRRRRRLARLHSRRAGCASGPESAGADPGPACYGRGGTQPTVTDANLVLGRFDPAYFLGGRMQLDVPSAEHALEELASQLDLDCSSSPKASSTSSTRRWPRRSARSPSSRGSSRATSHSSHSVAQGPCTPPSWRGARDPRGASSLATRARSPPGACSRRALRHDAARPSTGRSRPRARTAARRRTRRTRRRRRGRRSRAKACPRGGRAHFSAEMRYVGQEYTVTVEFDRSSSGPGLASAILASLPRGSRPRYGHANPQAPMEFVICVVGALGDRQDAVVEPRANRPRAPGTRDGAAPSLRRSRTTRPWSTEPISPPAPGSRGPRSSKSRRATTVVPPGVKAEIDTYGSIRSKLGGRS